MPGLGSAKSAQARRVLTTKRKDRLGSRRRKGGNGMSILDDYVPTDTWVRNYRAMLTPKLLDVLDEFAWYENHPYVVVDAVQRVVDHGGDIDTNIEACKAEARRRGLLPS